MEFIGPGFEEKDSILASVLKGILEPIRTEPVNTINAPTLAQERGLSVSQTLSPSSGLHPQAIRVRASTAEVTLAVAGTLFQERIPRIIEIGGYEIEAGSDGPLLIFENLDRPGVIGAVGTILGEQGTNIASFNLGRHAPGGVAMAAINLDTPASDETLSRLRQIPNMQSVRQIILPPRRSPHHAPLSRAAETPHR